MKIEQIEDSFWQIKEDMESAGIIMDGFEERLIELEKRVRKLEKPFLSQKDPELEPAVHPKLGSIKARVRAVSQGFFTPHLEQIGYWCKNNHEEWTLLDLYKNAPGLTTKELDELAAILEVP